MPRIFPDYAFGRRQAVTVAVPDPSGVQVNMPENDGQETSRVLCIVLPILLSLIFLLALAIFYLCYKRLLDRVRSYGRDLERGRRWRRSLCSPPDRGACEPRKKRRQPRATHQDERKRAGGDPEHLPAARDDLESGLIREPGEVVIQGRPAATGSRISQPESPQGRDGTTAEGGMAAPAGPVGGRSLSFEHRTHHDQHELPPRDNPQTRSRPASFPLNRSVTEISDGTRSPQGAGPGISIPADAMPRVSPERRARSGSDSSSRSAHIQSNSPSSDSFVTAATAPYTQRRDEISSLVSDTSPLSTDVRVLGSSVSDSFATIRPHRHPQSSAGSSPPAEPVTSEATYPSIDSRATHGSPYFSELSSSHVCRTVSTSLPTVPSLISSMRSEQAIDWRECLRPYSPFGRPPLPECGLRVGHGCRP